MKISKKLFALPAVALTVALGGCDTGGSDPVNGAVVVEQETAPVVTEAEVIGTWRLVDVQIDALEELIDELGLTQADLIELMGSIEFELRAGGGADIAAGGQVEGATWTLDGDQLTLTSDAHDGLEPEPITFTYTGHQLVAEMDDPELGHAEMVFER